MNNTTKQEAMQLLRDHRTRYRERERVVDVIQSALAKTENAILDWKREELRDLENTLLAMGVRLSQVQQWVDEPPAQRAGGDESEDSDG